MSDTPDPGYTDNGVPTFESVREKIETRSGTAAGSAELDAESEEGRGLEEQFEARSRAAADRIEEIARMLAGEEITPAARAAAEALLG